MDERATDSQLAQAAGPEPPADASAAVASAVPACVTWMAALILVMVGKVGEWVPGLYVIPLAKIAFLLAAIAAYRSRAALPVVKVRSLRVARPAIAFMTLALLSFSFSIWKSNTLLGSQFVVILLFSVVLLLKVTQTVRDIERLLLGFAAASASLSVGLVLNYHGGRASINGNFDPNDIAYSLVTVLPIVLALRAYRSRAGWFLMSGLTLMIVLATLLTGSRGGAIGLSVVTLFVLAFPMSCDSGGMPKRFSAGRTLVKFAALIVAVVLAWGYLPTATQQRMATLVDLQDDYSADPNLKGSRTAIWHRDVQMALDRPIGYGLDTAEAVDGLSGGQYRAAHNSLVQALVELGVLGLLLYLYSYLTAWRNLGRVGAAARNAEAGDPDRGKAALYARAMRIALAGNLAAGFFLSQAYSATLWMLIATAAALVRITLPPRGAVAPLATDASPHTLTADAQN